MNEVVVPVRAEKVDAHSGEREAVEAPVAVEAPINIYVNEKHVVTLLATPELLRELAIGWLLDEQIVRSLDEIEELHVKNHDVKVKTRVEVKARIKAASTVRLVTTSCGSTEEFLRLLDRLSKPYVKSDYKVKASDISAMVRELNRRSESYRLTGGTHSAALFADGKLVAFAEDVGRHNAVDKVIGIASQAGVSFGRCVLVCSGRQPADMVLKAARVGIPIVASMAGPIHSGVVAAEKTGVTLICFAKGSKMNIYTAVHRIRLD